MVCSDDRWLHVGTAVYGDKPSNMHVIDTDPSTMSSYGPFCPPFTFAPSAAPSVAPSEAPSEVPSAVPSVSVAPSAAPSTYFVFRF